MTAPDGVRTSGWGLFIVLAILVVAAAGYVAFDFRARRVESLEAEATASAPVEIARSTASAPSPARSRPVKTTPPPPFRPVEEKRAEVVPSPDPPKSVDLVRMPVEIIREDFNSRRPPIFSDRPPAKIPSPADFRYPKSAMAIRTTLSSILGAPGEPGTSEESSAALRRLKAYRYLAGLPYQGITLDAELNELATSAADICRRLNHLTHTPENPGLSETDYRRASLGAGKSNLAFNSPPKSLAEDVDAWMADSDEDNIDRLGHRRWCLNPSMGKTGFGRIGEYAAMWAHDSITPNFEDFTFIAHPTPGFMPVDFFSQGDPWSVTLNPRDYRTPRKESVEVLLYRLDGPSIDRNNRIQLDYFNVETSIFGIGNCIIFRPRSLEIEDGRRYWVEIKGLQRSEGVSVNFGYLVEFLR